MASALRRGVDQADGQQIPLSPRLEVNLLKVALRLLTNCFQFLLPKRTLKQGVNWVIYTVSVFVASMKLVKEGAGPRELFRFWLLRYLASGEEEEG